MAFFPGPQSIAVAAGSDMDALGGIQKDAKANPPPVAIPSFASGSYDAADLDGLWSNQHLKRSGAATNPRTHRNREQRTYFSFGDAHTGGE